MDREIISRFVAWDVDVGSKSVLEPGTILSACRILRNHAPGAEPYVVEFDCDGHRYSCPLFTFQARTQTLAGVLETNAVEPAVAA